MRVNYITCDKIRAPNATTLFFNAGVNFPLAQKYIAGIRKAAPIARPHILCPYSICHINLNSSRVNSLFLLKKVDLMINKIIMFLELKEKYIRPKSFHETSFQKY